MTYRGVTAAMTPLGAASVVKLSSLIAFMTWKPAPAVSV